MNRHAGPQDSLSEFATAYIVAALWSSTDDDGNPLDYEHCRDDIHPDTLKTMLADCRAFYIAHESAIHCDDGPTGTDGSSQVAMAGYDFWLTRCGHGAGFWDGDWPEPHAAELSAAAESVGNVYLYLGDDGKIHA